VSPSQFVDGNEEMGNAEKKWLGMFELGNAFLLMLNFLLPFVYGWVLL